MILTNDKWLRPRVLLLAVCLSGAVFSAAQTDYRTTEAKTLEHFNEKKWKALTELGENALEYGLDYYALRYRLGVAAFEQKTYWRSTRHFEKALHFNSADSVSQEYLYYAYLFSGREDEAVFLSKNFSESLREKLNITPVKAIDWVYAEAGKKLSTVPDSVGDMTFTSLWLGHRLGYRWQLTQAFSFLQLPVKTQDFNQYEYYLRSKYRLSSSFSTVAVLHYAFAKGTTQAEQSESRLEESDWIVQLGVEKRYGQVTVAPYLAHIATNVSQAPAEPLQYSVSSWQGGVEVSVVPPLRRSPLYLNVGASVHVSGNDTHLLWNLSARWQIAPKIAVQMSYLKSGASYFLEENGALFNNAISVTESRLSALLSYRVAPHVVLFSAWQKEKKKDEHIDFFYTTFLLGLKSQL
ncbi:MAG: hypothetical protein ACE5FF_09035 [Saprospiraceae bacterium]